MTAEARGKLVVRPSKNAKRVDQKPCHYNKDRYKKGGSKEFQFLFCKLVVNRGVYRQAGEERPDYARQVDALREETRHRHDCKHEDEICILIIFELPQGVCSQAT